MHHLGFSVAIEDLRKSSGASTADRIMVSMTDRIIPGTFKVNRAGVTFAVFMNSIEASHYASAPAAHRVCVWRLGQIRYYRLVTPKVQSDRVVFQAAPMSSTLNDIEYSAMWSQRGTKGFRAVPATEHVYSEDIKYNTAINDTTFSTSLKNNTSFTAAAWQTWIYEPDPRTGSEIVGISFHVFWRLDLYAQIKIRRVTGENISPPYYVTNDIATIDLNNGSTFPPASAPFDFDVTLHFPAQPAERLIVDIIPASFGTYMPGSANPEGTWFAEISNIRLVTSVTNAADATLTANATAGLNALITVDSTANMSEGQEVVLAAPIYSADRTVINSIVSTTQFRADLIYGYSIGDYARTLKITEREIITDILLNKLLVQNGFPPWINALPSMVQNSGSDIDLAEWLQAQPLAVMAELARDTFYSYGINDQGIAYFYPQGQNAREWLIDATDLEIGRPINGSTHQLYNRVSALYTDESGVLQLTDPADDLASQALEQIVRSHIITVNTTSLAEAEAARDAALADTAARPIESAIRCSYIMNPLAAISPADSVQEDDTLIIRNISPAWSDPALINIPVYEIEIDAENGQPSIVPKAPIPRLDRILARIK